MERRCIEGLLKFLEYPLLSQEWIKLRTSNLAGIFTGPGKKGPGKNGPGKKGPSDYLDSR